MSTSQRVLDSLRRIVRFLREGSRRAETRVGLTGAQLFVLQKLDPRRPLSLNELSERTLTHQSSVSVVVRRLVERGLVQRRPSPSDARRLELLPTRRGLQLLQRAPTVAQDRLLDALARLPPERRLALAGELDSLVRALRLADAPPPMLFADETPRRKRANKRA